MRNPSRPIEDRFWEKVQKSDGCWTWQGCLDRRGYGQIARGGKFGGNVKAHRLSYRIAHGDLPESAHVLHRCDNPACVRPDHLFLGTHTDNMRDMWAKNRGRCDGAGRSGEENGNHRLTSANVAEIIRRHKGGEASRALAAEFGVSKTLVLMISAGKVWRHIQEVAA